MIIVCLILTESNGYRKIANRKIEENVRWIVRLTKKSRTLSIFNEENQRVFVGTNFSKLRLLIVVDGRYSTRITFYRSRLSHRNSDDRIYSAVLKTLATYKSDKTVIWNLAIGICSSFWRTALRCLCDDHPPSTNFKKSNVIQIHWIVLHRVSSF